MRWGGERERERERERDGHLVISPRSFHDIRVKLIMPALANLFARSVWHKGSNKHPTLIAMFVHQLSHLLVLLVSPRGLVLVTILPRVGIL